MGRPSNGGISSWINQPLSSAPATSAFWITRLTAAVDTALGICDELVIVVGQSQDDTWQRCQALRGQYPGRIILHRHRFVFDTMWQQKWWGAGCVIDRRRMADVFGR